MIRIPALIPAWRLALAHERRATALLVLTIVPLFALAYRLNPSSPRADRPGWWTWFDQSQYLRAARAWAALSLDPAEHWYPAGTALLAAPFVHLTPLDPFWIPDLVSTLAAAWLFAALGARLAPDQAGSRLVAAATFVLMLAGSRTLLRSFIEPWTTTPAVPLVFGALLLGLRLQSGPTARVAAGLGAAVGAIGLVRPSDAVVLAAVLTIFAGHALIRAPLGWPRRIGIAAAGAAGAAVPVAAAVALHWATHGRSEGAYLAGSRAIGFEWRLLAIRWVTLVADASALVPGQYSLSQAFLWTAFGLAGMGAALVATGGRQRAHHALVIAAASAHTLVYLCYRDLEPQSLILYGNYHYFKWVLLLLGLYAVLLFRIVPPCPRPARAWAAGLGFALLLLCWKAEWVEPPPPTPPPRVVPPHTLIVDSGLPDFASAILFSGRGPFADMFIEPHAMETTEGTRRNPGWFRTWPTRDGMMLQLRRPMFDEAFRLVLRPTVTVSDDPPPVLLRAQIAPAAPWWMRRALQGRPGGS